MRRRSPKHIFNNKKKHTTTTKKHNEIITIMNASTSSSSKLDQIPQSFFKPLQCPGVLHFTSELHIAPISMMASIILHKNNNKKRKETWKVTGVQHYDNNNDDKSKDSSSSSCENDNDDELFCENPYMLKCYLNVIFETCRRKMYEETFLCVERKSAKAYFYVKTKKDCKCFKLQMERII
jgi:hypothetical protein